MVYRFVQVYQHRTQKVVIQFSNNLTIIVDCDAHINILQVCTRNLLEPENSNQRQIWLLNVHKYINSKENITLGPANLKKIKTGFGEPKFIFSTSHTIWPLRSPRNSTLQILQFVTKKKNEAEEMSSQGK